jgi:hypothetical protein
MSLFSNAREFLDYNLLEQYAYSDVSNLGLALARLPRAKL